MTLRTGLLPLSGQIWRKSWRKEGRKPGDEKRNCRVSSQLQGTRKVGFEEQGMPFPLTVSKEVGQRDHYCEVHFF